MTKLIQHGRAGEPGFGSDNRAKRRAAIAEAKAKLRVLALLIRQSKREVRNAEQGSTNHKAWLHTLRWQRFEYRHRHTALCVFRGRTGGEIEPSVRYHNLQTASLRLEYIRQLRVAS